MNRGFRVERRLPMDVRAEASERRVRSEVERRRTFAIISHPDAGKTTLTEKLLLFGGALREAGAVRAQRAARHATSDWLELEKQRGISVSSSAMHFDWSPPSERMGTLPTRYRVNILDTPGHRDFSEDTYRTLMAADSAVMLIDSAKGVEAQTRKLFEVCRLRHIPIFTFVNKLDRFGREPLDLMGEIEEVLGIAAVPVNWPRWTTPSSRGGSQAVISMTSCTRGRPKSSLVTSITVPTPLLTSLVTWRRRTSTIHFSWPPRWLIISQTRSGVARMKIRRSSLAIRRCRVSLLPPAAA